MGYTKDTLKGISWIGFFRVASRGFSYIRIAIIARLLTPAQFGISDIAIIVLSVTEIITETGINVFLTQKNENIDRYINTAWVVSIIRGFIISILILLSAPLISNFFNSQNVYPLLVVSSLVPILRGLINPSIVKFLKNLDFRKEFIYRTSVFFIESFTSVVFVFILRSPIAIIYGMLAGAIFEVILSFIIIKPVPVLKYHHAYFMEVIRHGKWLTATGIFNYIYHNGDNIIIGKFLGTASLGLYQRAYSISILPITEISDVMTKVTFPVYVKIADDKVRLRRAYYRALLATSIVIIPLGIIFYLFPEYIIRIILGGQWLSAAPVLKVLAVFGVIRALTYSSVSTFYAVKRQDIVTQITFASFIGLAITIIPFVMRWGIMGGAYSALFGSLLSLPITLVYLYKILYK